MAEKKTKSRKVPYKKRSIFARHSSIHGIFGMTYDTFVYDNCVTLHRTNSIAMKFTYLCFATYAILTMTSCVKSNIGDLRCEYLTEPLGIDEQSPRFTWTVSGSVGSCVVEVAENQGDLEAGNLLWQSEPLPDSVLSAVYDGPALKSHHRYSWRVNADGRKSAIANFETAKMAPSEWQARWISDTLDMEYEPAPMLRRDFRLNKLPGQARAYISASGYYELWINGQRVGDSHMDPGFTHYDKRNLYATYDVTGLLKEGDNTVAAVLGNGFANCQSKAVWDYERARWRRRPAMIFELREPDAANAILVSDSTWHTATGPYTYNNIYSGDRYDARLEPVGWRSSGFDDSAWNRAATVEAPSPILKAQAMPPIRPTDIIEPILLSNFGDTVFVFDMGRNIAGVSSLEAVGERSTHFKMSHGELLKDDGRLQQGNINVYYRPEKPGEKFQTDEFILAGADSVESFRPSFTYHGFRYVEVTADRPVRLSCDNVKGYFMHTDVHPVGSFKSSEPLLDKIYDATMLSYLDNIHSIPTDCPQREKNGWTADAHVAVDLALQNFDGITFYEKWMDDFTDNQRENGNISGIIPSSGWGYGNWPGPVWDAALFVIPEAIYNYYGDTRCIERMYPVMEKYFDWAQSNEKPDGLFTDGIGDWLSYSAHTPTDFTSSVYYYLDNVRMARFSDLLGRDASHYRAKAKALRDTINARWFDRDKASYANGSQAALGVALYSGIVPEDKEEEVARTLHNTVTANDFFLDYGLLGSKTVPAMLTRYGYVDDAFRMATKTDAPSWGYWLEKCGYTTLAETWTLSPEFHDASLNHVFMGDICSWMRTDLAGINYDSDEPGFANIIIRPHYPDGLDSVEATYRSVRGIISSSWTRDGDTVSLTVTVPGACSATVYAPEPVKVGEGTHTFRFGI